MSCVKWPPREEIEKTVVDSISFQAAADKLGVKRKSLRDHMRREGIGAVPRNASVQVKAGYPVPVSKELPCGVTMANNDAVIVEPATSENLGEITDLITEAGLDPEEWTVVSCTLNKWQAMTGSKNDNALVWMRQRKVTLKRAAHIVLAMPAMPAPVIKRISGPTSSGRPTTIYVEADHQAPYHDKALHSASLWMLEDLTKNNRLEGYLHNGDLVDFPAISRHMDHPAATASTNECIQVGHDILADKRRAAPGAWMKYSEGNHEFRLKSELLSRAERLFGIKPANEELPALSLQRLMQLDKLDIQFIEDIRGWEHGEVELVRDSLVARHGWLTGANTADKTLAKRGRDIIVSHTHQRDSTFKWNPAVDREMQAHVTGTMSDCRRTGSTYPHFAPEHNWLAGPLVVTKWPDGRFLVEHCFWDGETLLWRDRRYSA